MATTTKKPTRKKAPAKKTTHRKATKAGQKVHSFRVTRDYTPFFTFRISHQTFYWLILAAIVVGLAAWVLSISIQVQHIYDQIDATNQTMLSAPVTSAHKK